MQFSTSVIHTTCFGQTLVEYQIRK